LVATKEADLYEALGLNAGARAKIEANTPAGDAQMRIGGHDRRADDLALCSISFLKVLCAELCPVTL